ncbi:MAG TPA: YerC/YecD family TrpR-related protein [Candidatus Saccharimonadales bacterium]|nr:YerC/YecD family TrpR-related protein [Candidatus Saccharimonadales bacterium]
MIKSKTRIWQNEDAQRLAEAIASIDTVEVTENFLRDVMTETEIEEIATRFRAARMLTAGYKYSDIIERTKLSSRTVARISDWLKNGCSGYRSAMLALAKHHGHISPERLG